MVNAWPYMCAYGGVLSHEICSVKFTVPIFTQELTVNMRNFISCSLSTDCLVLKGMMITSLTHNKLFSEGDKHFIKTVTFPNKDKNHSETRVKTCWLSAAA